MVEPSACAAKLRGERAAIRVLQLHDAIAAPSGGHQSIRARRKSTERIRGGQRPTQPPTYTHIPYVTTPRSGLAAVAERRSQPRSLAVSRLTVYTVKDLNGGASLGFLRKELRPVR